jgi:hypothetical protein
MTTSLIGLIPARMRTWLQDRKLSAEIAALPESELRSVMRETGLTDFDLRRVGSNRPTPQELVARRLEVVGLDPGYVRAAQAATGRDLERVCGRCSEVKRCLHDLDRDDAGSRLAEYCPNTPTIDALLVDRER